MTQKSQPSRVWFSVMVLFAVNILNFYDRHVPGALVEPMRKEFHLDDTQIGLLGSAFIWIYALVGLPIGKLADIGSRKKILAWGVAIWTALTASVWFITTYPLLFFSRIGVGIGEASCAPTATSWLGDLFPVHKRSRMLALFMLGVPVGGALGYFFSGPLAQAYGWRVAMVLAAVPAVILVPALLMLPEPERGASEAHPAPLQRASMLDLLRIPTLWWIIASGALLNFNAYAFATFLPAFLSRVHGLSLANSGIATGAAYLSGGLLGGAVSGYLGDFIVRRRRDGRLLCAAALALIAVPFGCVGVLQPAGSLVLALVFLGLTYAALSSYYGFVYSSLHDIVAPNQRASAMAIYFLAMYLCGASFGPLLTGKLSDLLAHRAAALAGSAGVTEAFRAVGLQQAMLIIPALSIALAFVLYMGSRTINSDVERREAAVAVALVASD
ncbi:MAG TPA: MFS transporter [Candidatus Methylomirabilis sp.]|nr:MFS transporter [Candidatus Methylomirabilis sp.]